ncbi:MAG: phosphoenolpyruvate--protein phosphotransferase [SAR324 cluster bacterium]|jgi:phosphotransferase system enzyme I (PtsP)|nr:phosphoenolpyruvate--protein phosphotransferase [SAR324 cluster bacterium]MDP7140264.1 phosphoenolpyruvate--protein phosphotransferase [SAR324 cluster bacterium]HJO44839.1 phosphoenolpyruvate--protein phosphotransferase [SAR324 cluster bacterium]|tara:strand:+ start:114 stop:2384 length:2271 start_codon:yes stop_codon:yes gene_type:complete
MSRIITSSHNADETLSRTATLIAERMHVDASSIYIYDVSQNQLILKATHGLNPKVVEEVRMSPSEGLVGLVHERCEAVQASKMQDHPRFKHFPQTNEIRFSSFLGVPLVEHRKSFGVLVAHTEDSRVFVGDEIEMLKAIAAQISSLVSKALLLKQLDLATQAIQPRVSPSASASIHLSGTPVGTGIALGKAIQLHPGTPEEPPRETSNPPEGELQDFHSALEHTINDTIKLVEKISGDVGTEEAAIFHVHLMFLEDQHFQGKIEKYILEGNSVSWSIYETIQEYLSAFSQIDDPYLSEKGADLKDVGYRLLHFLGHELLAETEKEGILVIEELLPGDMARLDANRIKGIITSSGGIVSHAAILARSLRIPGICLDLDLMKRIHEGDLIALDGKNGSAVVHPGEELMAAFKRRVVLEEQHQEHLDQFREKPCRTQDGVEMKVLANIALENDLNQLFRHGAEGIGLYRTEIFFLSLDRYPEIEEQVEVYQRVFESIPQEQPLMIRTLDLGADKAAPYMGYPQEGNPYLGCRALRRQLRKPRVLKNQLKSILLASGRREKLSLIFPMVTDVQEIRQAKQLLHECVTDLGDDFNGSKLPEIGMMFEVPSSFMISDRFMKEIDFCAIGSNDLTQYLLAVDRNNPQISHLYDPLHPAVLQLIQILIKNADRYQKPVELCGEMASDTDGAVILAGLGLRIFSMNAPLIPTIKERLSMISMPDAERLAREALKSESALQVRNLVRAHFNDPLLKIEPLRQSISS